MDLDAIIQQRIDAIIAEKLGIREHDAAKIANPCTPVRFRYSPPYLPANNR